MSSSSSSSGNIEAALASFENAKDAAVQRLSDWLSIPSVSTRSEHAEDCRRAGMWLVEQLRELEFGVHLRSTAGHGIVRGSWPTGGEREAGDERPHVLFYGHYDVQPPEPIEDWTSPPFEPAIEDGPNGPRIVARGATDDKGQVMMFVEALRAWKQATGDIPCPVTLLVEGEEECGS
ncbi:MAG: M20/M25/M40 family metallo-hydrolase, partial [Planctomycetota bacterium]